MKPKKTPKREEKDGQLSKLRNRVRNLERENHRLKSELNSYEQAFKKTNKFLRDNTKDISLEDLIEAAKGNKSLKQVQKDIQCPRCNSSNVSKKPIPAGMLVMCKDCKLTKMEPKEEIGEDKDKIPTTE